VTTPAPTVEMPELTLVIVSWNSAELLGDSIRSFRASADAAGAAVAVVVVDNASSDDSTRAARAAGAETVIENPINVGFVVAASQGIACARSRWVMLANPDLQVDEGFVRAILDAAESAPDDVAALVPDVRFASEPTIVNSRGLDVDAVGIPAEREAGIEAYAPDGDNAVFGASSSASVLRVEAVRRVGGLEPAYFAYLEDVDVAWRLRRAGYRALLVRDALAVHEGSASTGEGSWLKAFLVARNRRILFRLHGPYSMRARALRAVTEAGHTTVQALSGSRDASVRGRLAALRTHRYTRFLRASNLGLVVPDVSVPLAPRFKLLETLRRKQRASLLMHREAPAGEHPTRRLVLAASGGERRLRVLVDAGNLKPGQGGIRTYTMGLIRALAHEPRLELVVAASVPEVAQLGPLELVPLSQSTQSVAGRALWRERRLASLAKRARADIVVAPVPELPFRRLSVPTVVVVHDVGPFVAPAFYTRSKRLRYEATLRHACSRATAIVCVSQATMIALRGATGIDAARCVVIGEGPQLLGEVDGPASPQEDPYLLYVGSLDPRKNVTTLLAAVLDAEPALPARLVITGPSEPGEIERLRLDTRRGHARVEHRGFVDSAELARLYRSAVGVVLPSLHEGFGLPVLEAFNAGVPVVASDIPSVREIAGDGALYVTSPLDPACWRKALRELCGDTALRDRLRADGRAVAKTYTWESVASRFAQLLAATSTGGRAVARLPKPAELPAPMPAATRGR
jgi:GT2 family glycosyltransferase/glycosyltransferase involved in cell wall biosynthesis